MAQVTNITCDSCGKVLYGKEKAAFVKLPNIQINGQIVVQNVDEASGWHTPIFVTRTPNERMNFCDLVCLQDLIDMKEKQFEKRREDNLRTEATAEQVARNLKGLE